MKNDDTREKRIVQNKNSGSVYQNAAGKQACKLAYLLAYGVFYSHIFISYMTPHDEKNSVEEISADEVEVVGSASDAQGSGETITKISADESTSHRNANAENPFEKLFENIEDIKKIRFFGPLALLLSLIGFVLYPLYLETAAIVLALLDLWKGSRFTKKISIAAIVIAALSLLNTWS